jgi:uncharacterized protein (DUF2236 family)
LFSSASIFWRINREGLLVLSGPRALLLELAHPLVAAGVAQHSNYRGEPLGRLVRTVNVMAHLNFSTRPQVKHAQRQMRKCHAPVSGHLLEDVGPYLAGTPYDATDPLLKLWVLATLIDSVWVMYDMFVHPLSDADKQAYYTDAIQLAFALGIPPELMPPTYDDFLTYMDSMLNSDSLTVGDEARAIVDALLYAPGLGPAIRVGSFLSIGMMPEPLRSAYGFEWDEGRERWLQRFAALSRKMYPRVPKILRIYPQATLAEWRAHYHKDAHPLPL